MLEAFRRPGRFWKGNLHTHTTRSDGAWTPAAVAAAYAARGYDFLCLSDHFMAAYGYPLTETPAPPGLTLIRGAELHAPALANGEVWHILAVGLPGDFAPWAEGESGPDLAARALAAGAFVALPHPDWYGLTEGDAATIPGAHAVEIWNHTSEVHVGRGGDAGLIDRLLSQGRRVGIIACDDAHMNLPHDPEADLARAWVMVRAEGPEGLVQALKDGACYATQGPDFLDVSLTDGVLRVACSPVRRIALLGPGSRAQAVHGEGLTGAEFPMRRLRGWARLVLTDAQGRQAWSQPLWP